MNGPERGQAHASAGHAEQAGARHTDRRAAAAGAAASAAERSHVRDQLSAIGYPRSVVRDRIRAGLLRRGRAATV